MKAGELQNRINESKELLSSITKTDKALGAVKASDPKAREAVKQLIAQVDDIAAMAQSLAAGLRSTVNG